MPVKYVSLDPIGVQEELRKRGYFFPRDARYALRLSRPDPSPGAVFKSTGQRRQIMLGGVVRERWDRLLLESPSYEAAADEVERICTGATIPVRHDERVGAAPTSALDSREIEAIIQARVSNEIARVDQDSAATIAAMQREIEDLRAKMNRPAPAPAPPTEKRRGRPKGSKNKQKIAPGDIELTPEQEEMLASLRLGDGPKPQDPV